MSPVDHDQELEELSWMVVNGKVVKKLDLIAIIYIYDEEYFTVYRRYNSVYEIVIRDYNNDIYVRKDEPIYCSIQDILCLSDEQMENMRTVNAVSFKYNNKLDTNLYQLEKMLWTDIQMKWYGLVMNMNGILNEYYNRKNKRMNNKSLDLDSDSDSDDNGEGELKETNEVDDSTESNTESTTESVLYHPNESTTDTSSDETPTSLTTPIKSVRIPIIPYAPKKSYTYLSRKMEKNINDVSRNEEENIAKFLSGKSCNMIIYPDQEEEYKNYSNKRKCPEESNDSDSTAIKTIECDDEGSRLLSSFKNIKYRKLYY